ncbi:hypothetical protein KO561_12795 [Radiobacillus kanasensis]|uniref:hypothetical protein n=1 Tax=Radiobacillus kanasensis TaxID=2844358 RepID=UPI001E3BF032|nr:hypothetical protein [Radiobacillus kanasensis]UFT98080.1 hypothetical protein KO561_12795 [Radiobacillus kanasensis]
MFKSKRVKYLEQRVEELEKKLKKQSTVTLDKYQIAKLVNHQIEKHEEFKKFRAEAF